MARRGFIAAIAAPLPSEPSRIHIEMPDGERRSFLTVERNGIAVARQGLIVGHFHFVNDVSHCARLPAELATQLIETHGILPPAERHGSICVMPQVEGSTDFTRQASLEVKRELLADVLIARAQEYGLIVKQALRQSGVGPDEQLPVFLAAPPLNGLEEAMESTLGLQVRRT